MSDIEKPSGIPPAIWIALSPNVDTLRLSEPVWVTYSVVTDRHEVYLVNFNIDGTDIDSLNYTSTNIVSAYIPTNLLYDGMHKLTITAFTATNTGSIADKAGLEAYRYQYSWPVFVNNQAKKTFEFNDPEFIPEGIKLSWPEYRYADFDYYELSWSMGYYQSGTINIYDPRQNSYIDTTYVDGCKKEYSLCVRFKGGDYRLDKLSHFKEIKNPVVHIGIDCMVDITWTHPTYEKNVKLYCIKMEAPKYGIPEEHDITVLNDTTLRLSGKIGFGGNYKVQLRYIPKDFNDSHINLNISGGQTIYALGDSIPVFSRAFQITAENCLLIYLSGIIFKSNFLTGENSDTISVPQIGENSFWTVTSSPDGVYFGYFENKEFVIRYCSDLRIAKKLDIKAFNDDVFALKDISISNNGLICTVDYYNNLRIFDLTSEGIIFEKHFDSNYYLKEALISPDGENLAVVLNDYDLHTTSLVYFSFNGIQLNELGRVHGVKQDDSAILTFSPETIGHKLIVSRWRRMYEYNAEVRDSRTFELLYSVEIPGNFIPIVYDFISDRLIARYEFSQTVKYSYLADMKTGELKRIVPFTGNKPLVFTGGYVFSGNGRSIKIDDFIR